MRGYTDKLLHLNLSELKISKENIPESIQEDFLGERGFAVKLLGDGLKNTKPLKALNCPLRGPEVASTLVLGILLSKKPKTFYGKFR